MIAIVIIIKAEICVVQLLCCAGNILIKANKKRTYGGVVVFNYGVKFVAIKCAFNLCINIKYRTKKPTFVWAKLILRRAKRYSTLMRFSLIYSPIWCKYYMYISLKCNFIQALSFHTHFAPPPTPSNLSPLLLREKPVLAHPNEKENNHQMFHA